MKILSLTTMAAIAFTSLATGKVVKIAKPTDGSFIVPMSAPSSSMDYFNASELWPHPISSSAAQNSRSCGKEYFNESALWPHHIESLAVHPRRPVVRKYFNSSQLWSGPIDASVPTQSTTQSTKQHTVYFNATELWPNTIAAPMPSRVARKAALSTREASTTYRLQSHKVEGTFSSCMNILGLFQGSGKLTQSEHEKLNSIITAVQGYTIAACLGLWTLLKASHYFLPIPTHLKRSAWLSNNMSMPMWTKCISYLG